MTKVPQEIEIKLLAGGAAVDDDALRRAAAQHGIELAEPQEREQTDIYLDDRSLHLTRAGGGLRVRETTDGKRLTLKLKGRRRGALHEREEHELSWSGALPDRAEQLPEALRDRVEPILYDAALRPVVVLHTRRRTFAASRTADGDTERAELCVDRVTVEDGHGVRAASFQELEIELAGGIGPDAWLRFAEHLGEELALEPSRIDKLERALRTGRVATLPDRPIELRPDLTLRTAALRVFDKHLRRIQSEEARVRTTDAAGAVHRLRVACRRLRASFQTFAPCFAPGELADHVAHVKRTAGAFGAVRDLDVLVAHLEGLRPQLPEALHDGHDRALAHLERRRRKLLDARRGRLREPSRLRALAALRDFVERPRDHDVDLTPRLRDGARRLLLDALDDVLAHAARLGPEAPAEDLHELRIRMKRLRYTAESFVDVWGAALEDFVARTTELQDALGAFNDAEVALARLRKLGRRLAGSAADGALAVGAWMQLQEQRRSDARRRFDTCWTRFDATALRPALDGLLTGV
ncbi:MAG: CHAD domain-containing protein [Planctomycetes bacterium]|nr:CHAD domain-containing protein [Planctomycetota bacterium]